MIIYDGISVLASLKRRRINDQRLYRTSRLTEGLISTVKCVSFILLRAPSDYGDNPSGLVIDTGTGALHLVNTLFSLLLKWFQVIIYSLLQLLLLRKIQRSIDTITLSLQLSLGRRIRLLIQLIILSLVIIVHEAVSEFEPIFLHESTDSTVVYKRLDIVALFDLLHVQNDLLIMCLVVLDPVDNTVCQHLIEYSVLTGNSIFISFQGIVSGRTVRDRT